MHDYAKALELTDKQLRMITGGGGSAAVNTYSTSQSNAILFCKMSNSPIGQVHVFQSSTNVQQNSVG